MTLATHSPRRLAGLCVLLLASLLLVPVVASAAVDNTSTGVLVVVPDRGFMGNQEVRDAFDDALGKRNAQLLFVTDERSEAVLDQRLASLSEHGAERIAVLPLVASASDARWQAAKGWLEARRENGLDVAYARPYGRSYLAVEDLSSRLRNVHTKASHLLLVGYGADTAESAKAMADDLERMGRFASNLEAEAVDAVIYPRRGAAQSSSQRKAFETAIKQAHGTLVVPVAFAARNDSMMNFPRWFADDVPEDGQLVSSPIATSEQLSQWLTHSAIEADMHFEPLDPSQVGIVALAHGADWFWNRDIRQALAPVAKKYKLAFAFTMADQPVIERAVRRLEKQGVRAIVIVRAFAMPTSFRAAIRRMIGADVRLDKPAHGPMMMAMHGGSHGHHAGSSLAAMPRIRSALPIVTLGGVSTSPLFTKSLLHNAMAVSKDPARETVILVAHGYGGDAANKRWLKVLATHAERMRKNGGDAFRAIRYATWREDWTGKREEAIAKVRDMVKQAEKNGGRALIVPARINGRGAADRYLDGMDFGWSQGFAQTPYFAQWFEQELRLGIDKLHRIGSPAPATSGHHTMHHH